MPQFTPGIRLPFEYIQGIPRGAAVQIRRDFEELIRNITPSPTLFDAIIDSELVASIPATHQYKNLTDLVANESWTGHFYVGVRQGPTAITEPGSPDLTGKGDLSLISLSANQTTSGVSVTTDWKFRKVIVPAGKSLFLTGLAINPNAADSLCQGYVMATGCQFGTNMTAPSSGTVGDGAALFDCTFRAAITVSGASVQNSFFSCNLNGGVAVTGTASALIYGGACAGFSSSSTAASTVWTAFTTGGGLTISAGGGVFGNTGPAAGNVSITDTTNGVQVYGAWSNVTYSGAPTSAFTVRQFDGSAIGTVDFTGPGRVSCAVGGNGSRIFLRGDDIIAELAFMTPVQTALGAVVNYIGATNTLVKLSTTANGIGSKPWAFDVASSHNILIFAGSSAANFTTAGTNAGSHNRIITEDSDSLLSSTLILMRDSGQLRGPPGEAGEDGEVGPPGPPGNAGPAGTNGSIGGPGPPGVAYAFDGADGDDGFPYPGPQGQQGIAGPAGSYGPPGMDGEPGDDGFPYPGPQGQQGAAGAPGAAGSQGLAGPIGADGVDGEDGMFLGPTGQPVADIYDSGLYGDKSMGNLAVDGTSAVTGMTRAGTVYTLTQDIYADFITLSGTVTVINAGNFRIFCKGLVALVNCIIHNDGAAGAGATGGVSPGFFTAGDNRVGGNGAAGAAGLSGGVAIRSLGGASGAGGAATAGPGIGGGTAGSTATALATGVGGPGVHRASDASAGFANNAANGAGSGNFYQGGAGGPGGTAAAGTGTGGGGGAGGGILYLFAQRVIVPAGVTLTLRAAGGAGGNGTAGTSAGTGGGAGGGGGAVVLVTSERTQVAGTLTLSVAGGNGGTPTGTGKTGTAGSSGNTYDISAV